MKKTTGQLARMAGGILVGENILTTGAAIDSRQVQPGNLYIPIPGARVDGHSFINQAREAGAACTLWQKDHVPYPETIPYILVDDTVKALGNIAHARLEELSPYVIGITGSNGKTSAKDMARAVFGTTYKTAATPGNRNSEIGLPLSILEFEDDIEVAILEMGMENFGEIDRLVSIAPIDAGIITTIGSAHMENLGSKENIAKAKLELLHGMKEDGILFYDAASREIETVLKETKPTVPCIPFGPEAQNIRLVDAHMEMDVDGVPYAINTLGTFQCCNALPVIALAKHKGIEEQAIQNALARFSLTGMRTHLEDGILDDSYKSNPESAKAALDLLASLPGRHIAALGDMLDLGPEELALHQSVLDHAEKLGIEVYTTGPIFQKLNHNWHETKEELATILVPLKDTDTTILVKGSRALAMDQLIPLLKKEGNLHE